LQLFGKKIATNSLDIYSACKFRLKFIDSKPINFPKLEKSGTFIILVTVLEINYHTKMREIYYETNATDAISNTIHSFIEYTDSI
jgi:hypothetical protein